MGRHLGILALAVVAALPVRTIAAERAVTFDPAASRVSFKLGTTFHEVRGTLRFAGGAIRFDPDTGAASGEITVDARSAESGNAKRDKTMHAEVLESGRFPVIVFRPERVTGTLHDPGRSDLTLHGVIALHGAEQKVSLQAAVESAGGVVRGDVRFTVPYVAWGLHDPSFFLVRAEKTVEVTIHAEGRWTDSPAPR